MAERFEAVEHNIARVRGQIAEAAHRTGRHADEITIVAVSKTFPAEAIRTAYRVGLRHFGESRVQECESKRPTLGDLDAVWHMIGHLQGNKVRKALELFGHIDSLDTMAIAKKLDTVASLHAQADRLPVLIEVDLGGEETKTGIEAPELTVLGAYVERLAHLELRGLLTIPPYADDPQKTRPYFAKLRELRDELGRELGRTLPVLSMGMSHDFEVAVEEGATEVRIGTAIFGSRIPSP